MIKKDFQFVPVTNNSLEQKLSNLIGQFQSGTNLVEIKVGTEESATEKAALATGWLYRLLRLKAAEPNLEYLAQALDQLLPISFLVLTNLGEFNQPEALLAFLSQYATTHQVNGLIIV